MKSFSYPKALVLIVCCSITLVGCTRTDITVSSIGTDSNSIEKTVNSATNFHQTSLNSENSQQNFDMQNNDTNISKATGPEIVDNLKSIEIDNLNDEKNSKVVLSLPKGWYAKELIFDKAPNFEYNEEKNKQIQKVYSFEFYNSMKTAKFNQYGIKGLAGEFYTQNYYKDQPESSRFPNHSEVKSRIFSGKTVLGQGEIFIFDCDLLKEMRTDKYSTYDMIYAWIPIKGEALAYNLSISVPLGEKDGDYIDMVKKILSVDNYTYINPNDIEWITMQGGLHIHTIALFPGHDDEKINRIVSMINSGTGKTESTKAEIGVIHSMARPIGICFQLKDGNKVFVWTDYTTKTFKNGWSATTLNDRFVLNVQNGSQDEYSTILSMNVAKYLREGWGADMPTVNEVSVTSESSKDGNNVVFKDGDKAVVSGDGCTAKEVFIHIRRNVNPKEDYIVGNAIPEFGKWVWNGTITKQFKSLDGNEVTLSNDLYDIIMDADGNQTGVCGVIDLRKEAKN